MKITSNLKQNILSLSVLAFAVIVFVVPNNAIAAVCSAGTVRYSSTSDRIYIEHGGECTLTDIKTYGPGSTPLTLIDPTLKIWYLESNIFIEDGSKLILHGSPVGGDVDELRLKSNNSASSISNIIFIRADYGTIDIDSTKIISWDSAVAGPDTEYSTLKRSYIHAKSRLSVDPVTGSTTPTESRIDIKDSEISYLGYYGSEAYGLSWKVLGIVEHGEGIFDEVGVFGDLIGNNIHHNYFGVYTYGGQSMTFVDNEVHDNVVYGIDPHDDSDFLIIKDNYVHHNGSHGIICSKRCNNLTITGNTSSYNVGNGIMLHRRVTDSLVGDNIVTYNGDTGIALFESHNNRVATNTSEHNLRGIRLSVGSQDNIIENNILNDNIKQGFFLYEGNDAPITGDGRVKLNIFRDNTVIGNGLAGLRLRESDTNTFYDNLFSGNGYGADLSTGAPSGNIFTSNIFDFNGNSYNIKLTAAHGTVLDSNTVIGSRYGILASKTVGAIITDNTITSSTKTGLRFQNLSIGNTAIRNTIDGHQRGLDLVSGSDGNMITSNTISSNSSYAVYIHSSNSNVFEKNILTGNTHNFYYAKIDATNTVKDSDDFTVKIGDTLSSMTILGTDNSVFDNKKSLLTEMFPTFSSILLDFAKVGKSRVTFDRLSLKVIPATDNILMDVLFYKTTGDLKKKWTESNSFASSTAVSHIVGDLTPGIDYDVSVDGLIIETLTADSSGEISFGHTDVYLTPKTFIVEGH